MALREPKAFLPLKASHFHILLSVVDGPTHGYGIRRLVDERTEGALVLAAGTLYETLQRLEDQGLIAEVDPPDEALPGASSRWRFFQATPMGRGVLAAEVARMEAAVAAGRQKLAPS